MGTIYPYLHAASTSTKLSFDADKLGYVLKPRPFTSKIIFFATRYYSSRCLRYCYQLKLDYFLLGKKPKKKVIEHLRKSLPDNAGGDGLMYKIYVRQSIEQGLKDVEEGRLVSHEDIKKNINYLNEGRIGAYYRTIHSNCVQYCYF